MQSSHLPKTLTRPIFQLAEKETEEPRLMSQSDNLRHMNYNLTRAEFAFVVYSYRISLKIVFTIIVESRAALT